MFTWERVTCDVISGGSTGLERSIDFGHVIVYTMFYDTIFHDASMMFSMVTFKQ